MFSYWMLFLWSGNLFYALIMKLDTKQAKLASILELIDGVLEQNLEPR